MSREDYARGRGHGFHGRGHHGRDFWFEWTDERNLGRTGEGHRGRAHSPEEMRAWHDFFHGFFGTSPEEHWIFGGRRFSPWHQGMDTFNPFVASLLSKGGGLLPVYVLHLVSQQPRYGNEIMDILAERTNGQWVSNPGAIYPLLNELEHLEFIRGEWADPSKRSIRVYAITPRGQEELDRIKAVVAPKLEETIKVLGLLMADFGQTQSPPSTETSNSANSPDEAESSSPEGSQSA